MFTTLSPLKQRKGTWMNVIEGDADRMAAIAATSELLSKLRLDHAFVGEVAVSAWLNRPLRESSVDVLAGVTPERSGQIPMMAGNRGFRVDRKEVEAAQELDLIPLHHPGVSGAGVRVFVLMASNALYARMIGEAMEAKAGEQAIRVVVPEDLALLLTMAEDAESLAVRAELMQRAEQPFDTERFNSRLVSIGLAGKTIDR